MSFVLSAQNVRLDEGRIIRCELQNGEGNFVPAEIDLDTCVGNSSGNFEWGGNGFSGSAQDISFTIEGSEAVPVLRAALNDGSGNTVTRDINLGERIQNDNGQLVFV